MFDFSFSSFSASILALSSELMGAGVVMVGVYGVCDEEILS